MVSTKATSVEQYLMELPEEKRAVISRVRDMVKKNLPKGFEEGMNWGMITWGIPLEIRFKTRIDVNGDGFVTRYPDFWQAEVSYAADR